MSQPERCPSLYDCADFATLRVGADQVRVCFVQSEPLALAPGMDARRRVLLIHGNPSQLDHWVHTLPGLGKDVAMVAYDQPGFGRSADFSDGRHTLERSVDTALALLDHVGWSEPVDVVGQSHGCMISIALAARAPGRVRSIALLGTGGAVPHLTYRLLAVPGVDYLLMALARPLFGRAWLRPVAAGAVRIGATSSFAPDPVPELIVAEELSLLTSRPLVLRAMVRLAQDGPCQKAASYAGKVTVPVIFIHGRRDALVDLSYARGLFDVMREGGVDARFVEVEGGHMVHFTQPRAINHLLHDWLFSPHRPALGH